MDGGSAKRIIAARCEAATGVERDSAPPCFPGGSDESSGNVTAVACSSNGAARGAERIQFETAIASAIAHAAAAGRFDVVLQLARELEARRLGGTVNGASPESPER